MWIYRCPACSQTHLTTHCCCQQLAVVEACQLGSCIGQRYQICHYAPQKPRCSHACMVVNEQLKYNFEAERKTYLYTQAVNASNEPACQGLRAPVLNALWGAGPIMAGKRETRDTILDAAAPHISHLPQLSRILLSRTDPPPIPIAYGSLSSIHSFGCRTPASGLLCKPCEALQPQISARGNLYRLAKDKAQTHLGLQNAVASHMPCSWPKPAHATPLENHCVVACKKVEVKGARQVILVILKMILALARNIT